MLKHISPHYYFHELKQNRPLTRQLYWYKKNKGINWFKGQNFGDYLACIIVAETARHLGFNRTKPGIGRRLFAIGSILHFAGNEDIIWGAGVNGKIAPERHSFNRLDVRMVRGPLTKGFLESRGITVNDVYGDPALLLPYLFPKMIASPESGKIIVIPNLNEIDLCRQIVPKKFCYLSPMTHWCVILKEILRSELVITSSLHALVLSEAFGVPVMLVCPTGGESLFKYRDYYEGTGRVLENESPTFREAFACIRTKRAKNSFSPKPIYDPEAMITAFPKDLFE